MGSEIILLEGKNLSWTAKPPKRYTRNIVRCFWKPPAAKSRSKTSCMQIGAFVLKKPPREDEVYPLTGRDSGFLRWFGRHETGCKQLRGFLILIGHEGGVWRTCPEGLDAFSGGLRAWFLVMLRREAEVSFKYLQNLDPIQRGISLNKGLIA